MGLFKDMAGSLPPSEQPAEKPPAPKLAKQILADMGLAPVAIDPAAPLPDNLDFRGAPVQWSADLQRIAALPRRELNPKDPSAASKWTTLLHRERSLEEGACNCVERWGFCITELNAIQGWALEEAARVGGILAPIGVGHGKTGVDLLIAWALKTYAEERGERFDAGRSFAAVLLIPANLKAQLLSRDYPQWAAHFKVPSLAGGGRGLVFAGRPILHVVTYNELSSPKSSTLLARIAPRVIIADEAHNLKARDRARGKRFLRYFADAPQTAFAGQSGTITTHSLKDYAHLAELALRDGSPLPLHWPTVEEWAAALDASEFPAPVGQLRVLCAPGETARQGFMRRLVETPGVVATEESALGTSLVITDRRPPPTVPSDLARMIDDVRELWLRPDGEELVDAIQKANVCRQLACGFFYRWRFPRGETREQIDAWLAARKNWHKEVREKLKYGREFMDSPLLVTKAAIRWHEGYAHVDPNTKERTFIPPKTRNGPQPTWNADFWPAWKELRDTVEPETEAVWVDDFLANDVAAWLRARDGKESPHGIVWYEHDAFGRRVAQLSGAPLFGPGSEASARILNEKGTRSIVASIRAHGTGKNLQAFACNLFPNPMSDGAIWEQTLARTHRPGQRADEVVAELYRHTPEFIEAFDQAMIRARYIQETTGSKMKLLYATQDFVTG